MWNYLEEKEKENTEQKATAVQDVDTKLQELEVCEIRIVDHVEADSEIGPSWAYRSTYLGTWNIAFWAFLIWEYFHLF